MKKMRVELITVRCSCGHLELFTLEEFLSEALSKSLSDYNRGDSVRIYRDVVCSSCGKKEEVTVKRITTI